MAVIMISEDGSDDVSFFRTLKIMIVFRVYSLLWSLLFFVLSHEMPPLLSISIGAASRSIIESKCEVNRLLLSFAFQLNTIIFDEKEY